MAISNCYILSLGIVPNSFSLGVIVPILKKPTLNPNSPDNYRPITLSSTLSKVLEVIMTPADTVSKTQFGFCSGRGTSFACNLLSDVTQYFHNSGSPFLYAHLMQKNVWIEFGTMGSSINCYNSYL